MKHIPLIGSLLIVLGLFLPGCAHHRPRVKTRGSFIYLKHSSLSSSGEKKSSSPALSAETVQVFYKKSPTLPFIEVGIVEAVIEAYGGQQATISHLLPELQRQAAKMAAHGIYKIDVQKYDFPGDALHATAVAIQFMGIK